jgi:hypothetical protein
MSETRKIVRAFLASPGDLTDERLAVREAVNEFNDMWAEEFSYQVELIGWEETVSSFGRPQELINQDLDRCDLFIGMMWKKWGTPPSSDGRYTSGFHEEFDRSLSRRLQSGSPEICLFFKRVPQTYLVDPGKDLQAVLLFKGKIIEEKTVYFREFAELSEIKSFIHKRLARFIRDIRTEDSKATSGDDSAKRLPATSEDPSHGQQADDQSQLSAEGFGFLQDLVTRLKQKDAIEHLSNFDIARFRLLSNSLSKHGNDEQRLGVHDANLLFANRNQLDFEHREISVLFQTALKNIDNENAPLWHWYSVLDGNTFLAISAFYSDTPAERAGAIRVLDWLAIGPTESPLGDPLFNTAEWFADESSHEVRNAALSYLAHHGSSSDLLPIRAEYERSESRTAQHALEAMIALTERTMGVNAAANLVVKVQFKSLERQLLETAVKGFSSLGGDELRLASEHRNADVRLAALRELQRRKELDDVMLSKFHEDADSSVRLFSVSESVARGNSLSDNGVKAILVRPTAQKRGLLSAISYPAADWDGEQCLKKFQKSERWKLSETELTRRIDGSLIASDLEYLVRAEKYFAKWADTLRSDIDDQFAVYSERKICEIQRLNTLAPDVLSAIREMGDNSRKRMTRDALDILCRKRQQSDIGRIRANLKSGYTPASVYDAQYLEKYGELADIQQLIDADVPRSGTNVLASIGADSEYEVAIAQAAYRAGRHDLRAVLALNAGSALLAKIVSLIAESAFAKIPDADLYRLLRHENESVRKATALKAVRSLSATRLERTLGDYLKTEDSRYYNVVFWLDLGVSLPRSKAKAVAAAVSS